MDTRRGIETFAALAAHHGVEWMPSGSSRFGADALRVNGKIFAALTRKHRLLLKLPPPRVAQLLAEGRAERFASGGRVMNGWITLTPQQASEWMPLADEARAFVAAETRRKPRKR
ncbi:MAG: luciferase family protein [Rhodanobacteraceae bacterium]